ncbi:PadR family transcriptional regulator [Streptomyces sp. NPDC102473]|uniref:PadR family transcriptional regulator n=1 Tax=Streptomyces sp. NPDC102473 TaxID=3366180 RepID=UPI003816C11A
MKVTRNVARVLREFIETVDEPRWGSELLKRLGMSSGTLYPILGRLTKAGMITARNEEAPASELGRPARRYYVMDPDQLEGARVALAEFSAEITPSTSLRDRWAGNPGPATGGAR